MYIIGTAPVPPASLASQSHRHYHFLTNQWYIFCLTRKSWLIDCTHNFPTNFPIPIETYFGHKDRIIINRKCISVYMTLYSHSPPQAEILGDLWGVLMPKTCSWVHFVMCFHLKKHLKTPKISACGGPMSNGAPKVLKTNYFSILRILEKVATWQSGATCSDRADWLTARIWMLIEKSSATALTVITNRKTITKHALNPLLNM